MVAIEHSFTVVGYCYNCATLDQGAKLSQAIVAATLPTQGVVRMCMLCDACRPHPHYEGWMLRGFPPPAERRGRLFVQAIGVCFQCLKRTDMVADFTGGSGRRMAPLTCSSACEVEARLRLDR